MLVGVIKMATNGLKSIDTNLYRCPRLKEDRLKLLKDRVIEKLDAISGTALVMELYWLIDLNISHWSHYAFIGPYIDEKLLCPGIDINSI